MVAAAAPAAVPERFWSKVDKCGPIPECAPSLGVCWVWIAGRNTEGYGVIWRNGRQVVAHRWLYEVVKGAVPVGLELDHLCRNRACVRTSHLEAVTHQVNLLRGSTINARNAAKTACPLGHAYRVLTYLDHGVPRTRRSCRTCNTALNRVRVRRVRAQLKAAAT